MLLLEWSIIKFVHPLWQDFSMNEIEILDKLHLFQSLFFVVIGEDIEITYSYWDGSGHRRTLTVETCGMYFFLHYGCLNPNVS